MAGRSHHAAAASPRTTAVPARASTRARAQRSSPRCRGTTRRRRRSCEMQFAAQDAHYQRALRGRGFDVILVGRRAGRAALRRTAASEIRIVDIALLPDFAPRHRDDAAARAPIRGGSGRQALRSTSSASTPRCGSTSGSGFGRSTIGGFICSWSGGGEGRSSAFGGRRSAVGRASDRFRATE